MGMKCARVKRAAARQPDAVLPTKKSLLRQGSLFRVAGFGRIALYPEGTMFRVDAVLLFMVICKTRKMQKLSRERLASALHLVKVSRKTKW